MYGILVYYSVYTHDVTGAIVVYQLEHWETAAMLASQSQSCGTWTLFLCKNYLLVHFMTARHVLETGALFSY